MKFKPLKSVTAFAPATCGNVIVGFDLLGLAIEDIGDQVTLTRRDDHQLVINHIDSQDPLPTDPQKNVAAAVIHKLLTEHAIKAGFTIEIKKGIAVGSGMGGSAASAVAALTALNHFFTTPLPLSELVQFSLHGEALCSGQAHADNIVPALYGGVTLTQQSPLKVIQLPIPKLTCVIVHPHLQINTKDAREILSPNISLQQHVKQSAYLASFISALYQQDLELLKQSLHDVIIEPQRAQLIPGFSEVQQAALAQQALGVSLSGSGPSLIAFACDKTAAHAIGTAMQQAFQHNKINSDVFCSTISQHGAYITSPATNPIEH